MLILDEFVFIGVFSDHTSFTSLGSFLSKSLFCYHPLDGEANLQTRSVLTLPLHFFTGQQQSDLPDIQSKSIISWAFDLLTLSYQIFWSKETFRIMLHVAVCNNIGPRLRRRWLWYRPWCGGEQSLAWLMGWTEGSQGQVGCWWWMLTVKSKSWRHLRCIHEAPENVPGSSWYLCLWFLFTKEWSNPKNWLSEFPVHVLNLQLTKLTSSFGMHPNGRWFSIEIGFTKQQVSDLRFRKDLQKELLWVLVASGRWWTHKPGWERCERTERIWTFRIIAISKASQVTWLHVFFCGGKQQFFRLGGRAGWSAGMQQAWHDLKIIPTSASGKRYSSLSSSIVR